MTAESQRAAFDPAAHPPLMVAPMRTLTPREVLDQLVASNDGFLGAVAGLDDEGWSTMEYRQLGRSGLRVSALTLGTMTFGGRGGFRAVGATDVVAARRQVDLCLDAGVNLIDTADVYSDGLSEEITGMVISGRRDSLLLSTKVRMSMGDGPNDAGLSRQHIIAGLGPFVTCEIVEFGFREAAAEIASEIGHAASGAKNSLDAGSIGTGKP